MREGREAISGIAAPDRPRATALPAMGRGWLLAPVLLLYGAPALLPVAVIVHFSLVAGVAGYRSVLGSPLLVRAATNTLVISLYATIIALALGFLLAATLWRSAPGMRRVLLAFILLPFWTAVLIKNFAWAALLQDNGAINAVLQSLGPAIDNKCLAALENWRFQPATQNGSPIASKQDAIFPFKARG